MLQQGSIFKGSLLVAGTAIGGGMLALPVLTCLGGFIPSVLIYFLCWVFMAITGLCFLEISLWVGKEANIVTMAEKTLGFYGKAAAWVIYLFLFYCLTIAYVVGCGNLLTVFSGGVISDKWGAIVFVMLFGPLVYMGPRVLGPLNAWMMVVLLVCFFVMVGLGVSYIDTNLLIRRDWSLSWIALPITFTAFAYQGVVPTLTEYLNGDVRKTKLSILIGSFIPFVAYIIWQGLILGIVPTFGPGGLFEALQNGDNAVEPLKNFVQSSVLYDISQYFAFLALLTSFLGVGMGLVDFLFDGLKMAKTAVNRIWICLLIFIPPLIIAYSYPHIFLSALDLAGGFGCALLLGLMPVLMIWSGRYYLGYKSEWQVPGGKLLLSLLILFVIFELSIEIKSLISPKAVHLPEIEFTGDRVDTRN